MKGIALFALLLLASCLPLGGMGLHRVVLALPPIPAAWSCLPDVRFELEWIGISGLREHLEATPLSQVAVELPRGRTQAIRAAALAGGLVLAHAGALYPAGIDAEGERFSLPWAEGGRLELDWLGGYAAEIAASLESVGIDPFRFDLARLARELEARGIDPWAALSPCELARRLAAGTFRLDALREPARREIVLPGPGPWAPESPLAAAPEPLASAAGGAAAGGAAPGAPAEAWSVPLGQGIHRFVGAAEILVVLVEAEGEAAFVRLARAARSE